MLAFDYVAQMLRAQRGRFSALSCDTRSSAHSFLEPVQDKRMIYFFNYIYTQANRQHCVAGAHLKKSPGDEFDSGRRRRSCRRPRVVTVPPLRSLRACQVIS